VSFSIVIPARFGSTRFPGKPLVPIAGRPLLHWVHARALETGADRVVVATDDERIAAAARGFGAEVVMTAPAHASGTDRIAEAVRSLDWADDVIVVNLQGDEPLMPASLPGEVAAVLAQHPQAAIATLAAPIASLEEFLDPNVVKVVVGEGGRALYFSRAPVPWSRDGAAAGLASQREFALARRHLGLYAYRVGALQRIAALPVGALEDCEKLEQLRALAAGFEIRVTDASERPGADVNTPADVPRVEALLRAARAAAR
jgi:3-deoxy-manno-octulosonate cytidylyltransferase (CMP-KDO synthetase)